MRERPVSSVALRPGVAGLGAVRAVAERPIPQPVFCDRGFVRHPLLAEGSWHEGTP